MSGPVDEVVDLVSRLIQFDTSNTGDPSTTRGERECALWVAEQLHEVGFVTEYVEGGAAGRGNLVARLAGSNPARGGLLIHAHLDVVPAEAADWSVHPFSGMVKDGYVWGRGAVDMKDMAGMMIAVARYLKRQNIVPPRDLVFAFVADEEAGSQFGAQWLVEHRPDLFDGVTEAIGEVGGFSLTLPHRSGGDRRFYLIETAEKSLAWMRLTARADPGHGSFIHDRNAVTSVAKAVARLGEHEFPLVIHDSVSQLLAAIAEETGWGFEGEDLAPAVARLGSVSRIIAATIRDTANPTMLRAGYKANVVPASAEAVIDCRIMPGRRGAFEATVDELIGPEVTREWIADMPPYETTFDGALVEAIKSSVLTADPEARVVPYMLSGGTDAKAFARMGIRCFGFAPLRLPPDLDFAGLFHGVDERVPVSGLEFGVQVLHDLLIRC